MADESRIPRNLSEYVMYMRRTTDYLLKLAPAPFSRSNWQRFYWTETELATWQSLTQTAEELFPLYSNKANRTVSTKNKIRQVRADTVRYNQQQKLLDRIASIPHRTVTSDFFTFNIKRGTVREKTKRTKLSSQIDEQVLMALQPLGGATLKIRCRTVTGTGRGHRHKTSNSVMLAYKIGNPYPKNVNDCNERYICSRTKFILRLETEQVGKRIYVFARWFNIKYPELAGPWSVMHEAVVV